MKLLGFTFGRRPTPSAHIDMIEEKFRAKLWSIRFLKKSKLSHEDIVDLFCTVIRPSVEYCCPTYTSMLTNDMKDRLERLQTRALKTVFGWDKSYSSVLELAHLPTLEDRRNEIFKNFALKTAADPRFVHWFPKISETGHNTRNTYKYAEEYARTDRYFNSPVFNMRRLLNRNL